MRLILDVGSGASLPDAATARRFVDEVAKRDGHKVEITWKAQLFESAPPNIPLDWGVFNELYEYAKSYNYKCTASVFDNRSLTFLLEYDIPFVKLACRPDLYWLAGEVPRKVPIYWSDSIGSAKMAGRGIERWVGCDYDDGDNKRLFCVRRYPAEVADYYPKSDSLRCVSDHTVGWDLWRLAWDTEDGGEDPLVWEKHMRLPETTGPDAGPWAVLPSELEEVIS